MVGELQKIFGLHAIARKLSVAGESLVFLMKLGGIAARAVVLPIGLIGYITGGTRPASTAATAAVLTIVDQTLVLVTGGLFRHSIGQARPGR
jgi:hypothetical protein